MPSLEPGSVNQPTGAQEQELSVTQKTTIPLAALFRYPSPTCDNPWDGFERYWCGGIHGLTNEMELHEILTEEVIADVVDIEMN